VRASCHERRVRRALPGPENGALDQRTSTEVIQLLTFVTRESGTALVMVTHDADAATHCGRILQVRDGRISSHSQYTVA
jgi:putative ABC transport system ATP-binding protein